MPSPSWEWFTSADVLTTMTSPSWEQFTSADVLTTLTVNSSLPKLLFDVAKTPVRTKLGGRKE